MSYNFTALLIASAFAGLLGAFFDTATGVSHSPAHSAKVVSASVR